MNMTVSAPPAAPTSRSTARRTGPLEQEVARRFLHDDLVPRGLQGIDPSIDLGSGEAPSWARPKRPKRPDQAGLAALRHSPMTVAAGLLFAQAIDAVPPLLGELRRGTQRIVIDVPDPLLFSALRGIWSVVLFGDDSRIEPVLGSLPPEHALGATVMSLVVPQPPKAKDRADAEEALLRLLQVPRPLICLSPDAGTHLPPAALRAADHRLTVPGLDPNLIGAVIRIVTGRHCRKADLATIGDGEFGLADLAIAVRADRSPAECLARLARLAASNLDRSGIGRDLSLDQLHGMADAVAWARSTLADLAAWRAGGPWSDVSSGAVIYGPPGTGKTLLASVMAAEGDLPFVTGSLPRWQSEDQAHLGTTLRAMRRTFDEARQQAVGGRAGRRGCVLLIDEIDSFPERSRVTHDHRDYVVEIVNSLLELLDGANGREGVIVIGTTNDPNRLDPALLRPGRLSRVLRVGYPDLDERVAMLRVRLGRDLRDVDLLPVARVTERATGAVVEQLVIDARRIASRAGRPLSIDDLLMVAGRADRDTPPAYLRRAAIHEAGHALVAGIEIGTEGLVVALQSRDGAAGWLDMTNVGRTAGTRADVEASIRILLAGRAAEEVLLGEPSAGAQGDLSAATTLVAHAVGTWGLSRSFGLLSFESRSPEEILSDPELRTEASDGLDTLYENVLDILRRHRDLVEIIADRLLVERRLDGSELSSILGTRTELPLEPTRSRDPWGVYDDPVETTAGSAA